jgi:hypothetical protein
MFTGELHRQTHGSSQAHAPDDPAAVLSQQTTTEKDRTQIGAARFSRSGAFDLLKCAGGESKWVGTASEQM